MKLIVAGGTGLVATEVIRQALQMSEITSVIALARKPVQLNNIDTSKLKTVIIDDYEKYPDQVKAEFAGADACIWTVAVTPMRSRGVDFAEVKRICQTCALAGFKTMVEAGPSKPFRFLYISAEGTPRDLTKKPLFMGEYQLMRGETENMMLAFSADHDGVEVCVAQPGMVTSSVTFWRTAQAILFGFTNIFTRAIPNISRTELATAMLGQVIRGFKKEPLTNADLLRLGRVGLAPR
ncbi:uncharacterized protein LY89DRAFT_790483 [Mollisia scopiformis]|uniref:NAD(P)-binding domain-containing protein n=1 Tax=Mollisia scopiformis TaxID=149040 RepID=A0A132B231_MOLSC|nr:uncharacterized protein LY89DRAFT_790483 [Mollisia scopiformis]KUJ06458.1 hypothetical protein LY89DRAFT_790483 [Mollisia scopiformis]